VVAEHELLGVRLQVDLPRQVFDPVEAHVVAKQRHGDDQGHEPVAVVLDQPEQLVPLLGGEDLLEVAQDVLEHVHVLLGGGDLPQAGHVDLLILLGELSTGSPLGVGDQLAQAAVPGPVVGHEQELLAGVEADQVSHRPAPLEHRPEAPVSEQALEEVLAQARVVEPAVLLGGEVGEPLQQGGGEQAPPGLAAHAGLLRVDLDPLHAARGGVALEDVAPQVQGLERLHALLGEPGHAGGVVRARLGGDQADRVVLAVHEADRLARDPHADLDLRAHGDELDELGHGAGEEAVVLVLAVVADLVAEEAGGDAHADRLVEGRVAVGVGHGPSLSRNDSGRKRGGGGAGPRRGLRRSTLQRRAGGPGRAGGPLHRRPAPPITA
jgi:hypothetical protein